MAQFRYGDIFLATSGFVVSVAMRRAPNRRIVLSIRAACQCCLALPSSLAYS